MAFDETTGEVYFAKTPEFPSGHIAMAANADIIDMAQKPQIQEGNVRMAARLHAESLGGERCVQNSLVDGVVELIATHPLR